MMKVENPFPGLRAFGVEESHLFFGRERPINELLCKLRTNRFISVVGTSGSGKSSLVRAGMLPDLHGGLMTSAGSSWKVALFRPGNAPIRSLAEALSQSEVFGSSGADAELKTAITETVLRRGAKGLVSVTLQARMPPHENLLVVVDQFEELFRFKNAGVDARASDEAAAFVKLLVEASIQDQAPIYVVLTMRSEFLGDCTQFRDLPEAINAGQYLIPRMTRDQQKEAIAGPVAVGGARITPRLLQRLLNDVGDNPDQLPILQHAMMRTWDNWVQRQRPDEPIDISHYEAIGTMTEALSRHADEAFNELSDDTHRRLAERMFKRLTEKGTDNRELRFPAQVGELCSIAGASREQVVNVIEVFRQEGRWFLMPPPTVALDDTTLIDISHESLIRIWTRLRLWVSEEAESARIYKRLEETSALFDKNQAGLWRNPDLQIALQWRELNIPNKAWAQRYSPGYDGALEFLNKSKTAARRRRLLTLAPIVLLPLLLVGLVMGVTVKGKLEAEERAAEEGVKAEQNLADLNAIKAEVEEKQLVQGELIATAKKVVSQTRRRSNDGKLNEELMQRVEQLEQLENKELESTSASESDMTDSSADTEQSVSTSSSDHSGTTIENNANDLELEASKNSAFDLGLVTSADGTYGAELEASKDSAYAPELVSDAELVASAGGTRLVSSLEPLTQTRTAQFETCSEVDRLEPRECSDEFPPGKVWVFARVKALQNESLTLIWYADGDEELRNRQLSVQRNLNSGYRTYDWKTLYKPGPYEVRLFDSKQVELDRKTFRIREE